MLSMDCCIVVVLLLLVEGDEDCTNNAAEGGRREFRERRKVWGVEATSFLRMCVFVCICVPTISFSTSNIFFV